MEACLVLLGRLMFPGPLRFPRPLGTPEDFKGFITSLIPRERERKRKSQPKLPLALEVLPNTLILASTINPKP